MYFIQVSIIQIFILSHIERFSISYVKKRRTLNKLHLLICQLNLGQDDDDDDGIADEPGKEPADSDFSVDEDEIEAIEQKDEIVYE